MKLINGDDLRARLGMGNVDTMVAAADNAADEATLHIETDLRTSLLLADYKDLYIIQDADRSKSQLTLRTTAGFLQDGWEVGTGVTKADAEIDTSLTDLVIVNATHGTVLLNDVVLSTFVSVRYSAGFAPAPPPNTTQMFDLTGVPEWLIKAAELKAISVMADSPELDNKDGKLIDGKSFSRQYSAMIERYIRYIPDARSPLA